MKQVLACQKGFTLIEAIIYLALFGILFSGALAGAYSIMETGGKNNTQAMMQEEGEFLLAKINYIISNSQSSQVQQAGRLAAIVFGDNYQIRMENTDLVIEKNSESPVILNNSAVYISNLSFADAYVIGANQQGIDFGFDLNGRAPNGSPVVMNFKSTAYLRK